MSSFSFFGPQKDFPLSVGSMKLPCHFREVHYAVALFAAAREKVNPYLSGKGIQAALPWTNDRVMVALGLIHYTDSDLGAYDEVIVAVPSVRVVESTSVMNWAGLLKGSEHLNVGMHILHIPVTSERSRIAGVECWGYPKRVLPINHQLEGATILSDVKDEQGATILNCTGRKGWGVPIPTLQLMTYSLVHGRLTRTPVQVGGGLHWHPFANIKLVLGNSTDMMAVDLRALGLDGATATFFMDSPGFKAVFGAGKPV